MLHVLNIGERILFWSVEGDDDGADDAHEAAHFADKAESFFQEDGGQDRTDDDGEGSQGGDEDGIGKHVCGEVAYLANDHEGHA